ncbi:MAG: transposase, partial [Micrococcaceae bacterium]
VMVDGIYIGKKARGNTWCCLIAMDAATLRPLAFQWCDREKTIAWKALFKQLVSTPDVIICDGGQGLNRAIQECFPHTKVQRCLVHVVSNTRVNLTNNPQSDASKSLLKLARNLTKIKTKSQAIIWQQQLHKWYETYGHLIKERTINPEPFGRRWWYTHERLRRAYRRLEKLANDQVLFTYLETGCDATTNKLEGGINTGIRYLLRNHRGLNIEKQKTAVQWHLWAKTHEIKEATALIKPEHYQPKPKPVKIKQEQIGPKEIDKSYQTIRYKGGAIWANTTE